MSLKTSTQIVTDLDNWKANEVDVKISNGSPLIFPNTHNFVLEQLNIILKTLSESAYNKADGLQIVDVTGLQSALANKEPLDPTILKQSDLINDLLTDSAIRPASASTVFTLKNLIDSLPPANQDTQLASGTVNQVSATELRVHLDNLSLHRQIDDSVVSNIALWSSTKIDTELASKSDVGHTHTVADITDDGQAFTITGDGISTSFTVVHGLNSRNFMVQVWQNFGTYQEANATLQKPNSNELNVVILPAPGIGEEYRVFIKKLSV